LLISLKGWNKPALAGLPLVAHAKDLIMRATLALVLWLAVPAVVAVGQETSQPYGYGTLPRGAWACLGSPRFICDKPVYAFAFSPDGKWLATGTSEYNIQLGTTVHLWDLATGQERVLAGHKTRIVKLGFTPDSKIVAATASDGNVRVWEVANGKEIPDFDKLADVRAELVYSWVRKSKDGKIQAELELPTRLALTLSDCIAGKELLRIDKFRRPVQALAFTNDGKFLATGGYGFETVVNGKHWLSEVKVWEVATGKELFGVTGTMRVGDVAFSPDGQTLAFSDDFDVFLWDWRNDREMPRFAGHNREVTALCFAPDGSTLCSASRDGTIRVWDAKACKELGVLRGHTTGVKALSLSPAGRTLASGGMDGCVRLWELQTRKEIKQLVHTKVSYMVIMNDGKWVVPSDTGIPGTGSGEVWCLAFSPDGKSLVSADRGMAGTGGKVRLWDWQAGKEIHCLAGQEGAHCLAFTRNGKALTVGFHGRVSTYAMNSGKDLGKTFAAHHADVDSLAYLRDGSLFTVGRVDGLMPHVARLWNPSTAEKLRELAVGNCYTSTMAVSADSRLVAVACETRIHVWETSTWEKIAEFEGHRRHVAALAFSPDGTTLASGGADGAILYWDLTGHRKGTKLVGEALKPAALQALWQQLAEKGGRAALWTLALDPDESVPFLRAQLPVIAKTDAKRLQALVLDLDAKEFAVREKAASELGKLGEAAVPALESALHANPSAELATRAKALLKKLAAKRPQPGQPLPAEVVQMVRAIEALERAGTPEALEVLREIAAGEPAARQTKEAQAALKLVPAESEDEPQMETKAWPAWPWKECAGGALVLAFMFAGTFLVRRGINNAMLRGRVPTTGQDNVRD
jgi:WD40 repeat protein